MLVTLYDQLVTAGRPQVYKVLLLMRSLLSVVVSEGEILPEIALALVKQCHLTAVIVPEPSYRQTNNINLQAVPARGSISS